MKDKILELSKGKFQYKNTKLQLSTQQLRLIVVQGEEVTTRVVITAESMEKIKGFLTVEEVAMVFPQTFFGITNEVEITVSAKYLLVGDVLQGKIYIVTNVGEAYLPYSISVVDRVLKDEKGLVRTVDEFVSRTMNSLEEGISLFYQDDFSKTILKDQEKTKSLYEHLVKRNTKAHALEEFLVKTQKKEFVHFEVSPKELIYSVEGKEELEDTVMFQSSGWGTTEIKVFSQSPFITLYQNVFSVDELIGNRKEISFVISGAGLKQGKHYGSIRFESAYESGEIIVIVHKEEKEEDSVNYIQNKKYLIAFMKTYVKYKIGKMSEREYKRNLHLILEPLEDSTHYMAFLAKSYIYFVANQNERALQLVNQIFHGFRPDPQEREEDILVYLLGWYIKSRITGSEEDKLMAISEIRYYYENGNETVTLFYLLLKLDDRYQTLPVKLVLEEITAYLDQGEKSPLLYWEFISRVKKDVSLLRNLNAGTIRALYWGMREDLLDKEFAISMGFMVEHIRGFSPTLFQCLVLQYEKYKLDDTLHCLCSMLIRNEIADKKYFIWFALGVEKKMRITELFEYYMYSIPENHQGKIPQTVIKYFQYENHLSDSVKAYLFAQVTKDRKSKPENYTAYGDSMWTFALRQLGLGRINKNLAVIYEGLINAVSVNGQLAQWLPEIMFKHHVIISNDNMEAIKVIHLESEKEEYYPLVNQCAYIDIYTSNYQIYFLDKQGRYHVNVPHCSNVKMLNLDRFAMQCFENGGEQPSLMVHLFGKINEKNQLTNQEALICTLVSQRGLLSKHYQLKNSKILWEHYRKIKDASMFEEILLQIDLEQLEEESVWRRALFEDFMEFRAYEKAFDVILKEGFRHCRLAPLFTLIKWQLERVDLKYDWLTEKICHYLYQRNYKDESILTYLMKYHMGRLKELRRICFDGIEGGIQIPEEYLERLLGQVLFTESSPESFYELFYHYYKYSGNRTLVKAYISYSAYGYLVNKYSLPDEFLELILKEDMYGDSSVLTLAALKKYSEIDDLSREQKEYIDFHISRLSKNGIVMSFMKKFIGRVPLPYDVENAVIVEYFTGARQSIKVLVEDTSKSPVMIPMEEVLYGIYIKKFLLFHNEEMKIRIVNEESREQTKVISLKRKNQGQEAISFYSIVNEMIEHQEKNNMVQFQEAQRKYKKYIGMAEKLFHPFV